MVRYRSKVMHVEDDILNAYHILQNRNAHPMEDKTVVRTTSWCLYIKITQVTLSSLTTQISAEIRFQKSESQSYPLSTFVVQNTLSNQAKQKIPQMLSLTKWLKGLSLIQFWRLIMMKEKYTYSQVSNVQWYCHILGPPFETHHISLAVYYMKSKSGITKKYRGKNIPLLPRR